MRNKFIFLGLVLTAICLSITSADARLCFLAGGCKDSDTITADEECQYKGYLKKADCETVKGAHQQCTQGKNSCWYPECIYQDSYDCQNKAQVEKCAVDEYSCAYALDTAETCRKKGYTETVDKTAGAGTNCWRCDTCDENSSYYKCEERSEKNGYAIVNGACVNSIDCSGMLSAAKDSNCWDCTTYYKCTEKTDKGEYKIDNAGQCLLPSAICRNDGYTETEKKDSNCWSCEECTGYEGLWKCEIKSGVVSGSETVENANCWYAVVTDAAGNQSCEYKAANGYEAGADGVCTNLKQMCRNAGYIKTAKKDSNCWSCEECSSYSGLWKCTKNLSDGYKIENGVCVSVN